MSTTSTSDVENIVPEWKDLVLSMPIEPGWVTPRLHQYQGFWYNTRQVQVVLSCQKHFRAKDTDVILITIPKSGTTWLKAILFSLANRSSFPEPELEHPLLAASPHVLVPFLELNLYLDGRSPDLDSLASPRLFSTHMPYASLPELAKSSACRLVYLCRDPKDILVSLWHFTNKLRRESSGHKSMEECFGKFIRGVSPYGPFWDHFLGYWKESLKSPSKVLFLRYEDMKRDPGFQVRKLAEFVGCPFSEREEADGQVGKILKLCSLESLSNLEVNKRGRLPSGVSHDSFFRRGEVGDWVNYLTPDMAAELDSLVGQKLQGSGLKF